MSGICGVIMWDGNPASAEILEAMAAATPHRGSITASRWTVDGAALAALQRPDEAESAIGYDSDAGIVVVADARLDNRTKLMEQLAGATRAAEPTAAEVILAAVRTWGHEAPARLLGDFAYVAWDARRRSVFAARDPMGLRTLHHRIEPGRLLLATDIAQLVAVPGTTLDIDDLGVAAYLLGEPTVSERTPHRGIRRLVPGTQLKVNADGAQVARFWSFDPEARIRYRQESEYYEHFAQLFTTAVTDRIAPYRTAGVMLSGGQDSGAIASTAGNARRAGVLDPQIDLYALSWAFDELTSCDERHISRHIVDHYGLGAVDIPADDAWPLQGYPAHGPDVDEPRVGVYQSLFDRTLHAAAARDVGVLFTGDRGDEVVGSWVYDHVGLLLHGRWSALRAEIAAEATTVSDGARIALRRLGRPLAARAGVSAAAPPAPLPPPWVPTALVQRAAEDEAASAELADPALHNTGVGAARLRRVLAPFTFQRASEFNRRIARWGIDYADPWSDRRLTEFVVAVPAHLVNRIAEPKRMLRESMRGIVPEPARTAASKIEPVALFHRGYRDRARDILTDLTTNMQAAKRGLVEEQAVRKEIATYLSGGESAFDWWRPVSLEMWLRAYWPAASGMRS